MTNRLHSFIAAMLFLPLLSEAQAPTIGSTAANFVLFTSGGALTNDGASVVTGDVGTQAGNFSGFGALVLFGSSHIADPTSVTAATEVDAAYASFSATCGTSLTTPLGGTTPLAPGEYCTGGAASLTGDLILDGNNEINPTFVIKIGGAFSTGPGSRIILRNGATLSNVFFKVAGAVSLGPVSTFRGTIIANEAIELAPLAILYGKAFTTAGAISLHNNIVTNEDTPLPVTLTSFNVRKSEGQTAVLSWTTTAETNSDRFDIEHSIIGKLWETVGSVAANGESNGLSSYSFNTQVTEGGVHLYRLKMLDKDNTFAYSSIRKVDMGALSRSVMYPNPAINTLTLDVADRSQVERIQFQSISGKIVYDQSKTASSDVSETMDVSAFPSGMYMVRITRSKGVIDYLKILKL